LSRALRGDRARAETAQLDDLSSLQPSRAEAADRAPRASRRAVLAGRLPQTPRRLVRVLVSALSVERDARHRDRQDGIPPRYARPDRSVREDRSRTALKPVFCFSSRGFGGYSLAR